jgi:hypothetical protein
MTKVAGLFAARSRPPAPSTARPPPAPPPAQVPPAADTAFESLLRVRLDSDAPRPRFILAAAERAAERRALAEALRAKRIEREIARLERTHGPYIRFDTGAGADAVAAEAEPAEPPAVPESAAPPAGPADGIDLAGMRRRYFERLESADILRLRATPAQLALIVNWVALARPDGEK